MYTILFETIRYRRDNKYVLVIIHGLEGKAMFSSTISTELYGNVEFWENVTVTFKPVICDNVLCRAIFIFFQSHWNLIDSYIKQHEFLFKKGFSKKTRFFSNSSKVVRLINTRWQSVAVKRSLTLQILRKSAKLFSSYCCRNLSCFKKSYFVDPFWWYWTQI